VNEERIDLTLSPWDIVMLRELNEQFEAEQAFINRRKLAAQLQAKRDEIRDELTICEAEARELDPALVRHCEAQADFPQHPEGNVWRGLFYAAAIMLGATLVVLVSVFHAQIAAWMGGL
jgi:hypothetical protein